MKIDYIEHTDPYLNIYLHEYEKLADHYAFQHTDPASVAQRLLYLDGRYDEKMRKKVSSILLEYNKGLNCGDKTVENISLLMSGRASAVVTGQQTGILTGPMYTIYKIITAVLLAKKISDEHDTHAVPVFWAASEDHDFREIASLSLSNESGSLSEWTLSSPRPGRISIGYLPLNEQAKSSIDFFGDNAADGPYKEEMLKLLNKTFSDSITLSEWCCRIISALFEKYGLIVVDSMDPQLRYLSADIFRQALIKVQDICAAVDKQSKKLIAKGLKTQLTYEDGLLPFFHNSEKGRFQIHVTTDGEYIINKGETGVFPKEKMLDLIRLKTDQFSPNVMLRPIIQDHLLPTVAYIAGPGELAYYGQLKEVYPLFGMQMPIIQPRISATMIIPEIMKNIDRLGLSAEQIILDSDKELQKLLNEKEPFPIEESFSQIRSQFDQLYSQLTTELIKIDPDLMKIAEGNLGRILFQVDYLEKKTKQKLRKREKGLMSSFEIVQEFLMPKNKPQERTLNIFSFLASYGDGLIETLAGLDSTAMDCHQIIYLGDDQDQ